jgi:hypothetical protein
MCRRERPSSGAQLSLMEEADGWRYQLMAVRHEVALVQVNNRIGGSSVVDG